MRRKGMTITMSMLLLCALIAAVTLRRRTPGALLATSLAASPASAQLPPPPPMSLGMNAPALRYYASNVAFANLLMGSEWMTAKWVALPDQYQDKDGNLIAPLPDGSALRFILIPPTGSGSIRVRCTYAGSGSMKIAGQAQAIHPIRNGIEFTAFNNHKTTGVWLVASGVTAGSPMKDFDCRDVRLPRSAKFRPEFLASLRGYSVIRFMDWQNANANEAIDWPGRHLPSGNRTDRDGVSIEDMLALCDELHASPWFVMPWNATDAYISGFARMVARQLPADRSVYLEVGNEVWNPGFPVAQQAVREGRQEGLGTSSREAGMRRYAERTTAAMRFWDAAFASRKGLVRVLSTQHVIPDSARIALSFRDTARHVDALATAPYFGTLIGGGGHDVDRMIDKLGTDLTATLAEAKANRAVATAFGKRYVAYESGQGLTLPADVDVLRRVQTDPRMFGLYMRFLGGWKEEIGDLLCLLTSIATTTSHGAWGLEEWEDQSPAEAPKLRAVRDFMARHPDVTTAR